MRPLSLTLTFSKRAFHEVDAAIRDIDRISCEQLPNINNYIGIPCFVPYLLLEKNIGRLNHVLDKRFGVIRSGLLSENGECYLFVRLKSGGPLIELLEIVERYVLLFGPPVLTNDNQINPTVDGSKQRLQQSTGNIGNTVGFSVGRITNYTTDDHSAVSVLTKRQREVRTGTTPLFHR